MALAMEMMGIPPSELLGMDELERQLALACATELEKWRLEQYSKMFGR